MQANHEYVRRRVGAVVIGRNEGRTLRHCIESLFVNVRHVVYVDSGSTDGSPEMARQLGAQVVELDLSQPFTAARARNEGIAALARLAPEVEHVQVVDGDCVVIAGWIQQAVQKIDAQSDVAIVAGRRRELFPEASIYNKLCDMEWDRPAGETKAVGGDALIRLAAFQQVGGYDATLIAGEEPELCLRFRQNGWTVVRLSQEMTLHDARMTRFGQWWQRNIRAGHAFAEGAASRFGRRELYRWREVRSLIVWALVVPLTTLVLFYPTLGISVLLMLLAYAWLWNRIRRGRRAQGDGASAARLYAGFCVLGKFPQLYGATCFWMNSLTRRRTPLIEYK